MTSSLFISYSRRELPFVDSLMDELEDRKFSVWLDYHSMVPAQPWQRQIFKGIDTAEIFLLVVSQESLASKNVKPEWQRAIKQQKRIILIIFEAVALPPQLQSYEWIDFRTSFKKGLAELEKLIQSPQKPQQSPPQKGFKAPPIVWISFAVSLIVGLVSLLTLWTLYIPMYLFPLSYRILKRDFSFFHVQNALLMMPVALVFTAGLLPYSPDQNIETFIGCIFLMGIPSLICLIFLLRSAGMQRWGKPSASRPSFANPYSPNITNPKPTRFMVDFAPQDKKYADDIITGLQSYGHLQVADAAEAETVFVLLSAYKNSTAFKLEEQVVYPITLQDVKDIDRTLARIQWIDFRRGLKHVDKLAQLLPEPVRLLKALAVVPMSRQTVLPPIIQALVFFLTVLAVVSLGGWTFYLIQLMPVMSWGDIVWLVILMGLFLGATTYAIRSLVSRRGWLASLWRFLIFLVAGVGLMMFAQLVVGGIYLPEAENDSRGLTGMVGLLIYVVGMVIIALLSVWHWRDLRRWFPHREQSVSSQPAKPDK
ncbi:MAG: toll/interleukin-1 receptor domain-containing protein [Anaerolineae bacterium]